MLVVEDDPQQRDLLAEFVARAGYKVAAVPDAEAAGDRLATDTFDLLLSDYRLPGASGAELIKGLKQQGGPMLAVLISAHADLASAAEACGADAYLSKGHLYRLRPLLASLLAG